MIFRQATHNDADDILKIYKSVLGTQFCVWNENYPTELEIEEDLATDNLYILCDNEKIVGCISIVPKNELDGYPVWSCDGLEIARVVVSPTHRGRGLALIMVEEIKRIISSRNSPSVHLSAEIHNAPALHTYEKAGFKTVGEDDMFGGRYYLLECLL